MNSRGSILVQVLIMGVLLLLLVTMLIRAVVQHYQLGTMAVESARSEELGETSIQAVNAAWANPPLPGVPGDCCSTVTSGTVVVTCSGSVAGACAAATCNCTCTVTIGGAPCPPGTVLVGGNCQYPSVIASWTGSNCGLRVQRQYP